MMYESSQCKIKMTTTAEHGHGTYTLFLYSVMVK